MRILVTAGPTREFLDPIRFLSNTSTGRMGFAVAEAALDAGHQVVLVAGPVVLTPPPEAVYVPVVSAQDMFDAVMAHWPECDGAVAVAAVADFRPAGVAPHKLKKTGLGRQLELVPTVDILATLGEDKGHRWLCGFALESEDLLARARAKMAAKNLDLIVANEVTAMGQPATRIVVLDQAGHVVLESHADKRVLARQLVGLLGERFAPRA